MEFAQASVGKKVRATKLMNTNMKQILAELKEKNAPDRYFTFTIVRLGTSLSQTIYCRFTHEADNENAPEFTFRPKEVTDVGVE